MNKLKVKEVELAPEILGLKLDSDRFSLTIAPQLGGKITSLINKKTKREFIAPTSVAYRRRTYGDRFEDYERDGADECFPTVLPCEYPDAPWRGVPLGDHGLLAIANAQHRHVRVECFRRDFGGAIGDDRCWPAGQDHRFWRIVPQGLGGAVE